MDGGVLLKRLQAIGRVTYMGEQHVWRVCKLSITVLVECSSGIHPSSIVGPQSTEECCCMKKIKAQKRLVA